MKQEGAPGSALLFYVVFSDLSKLVPKQTCQPPPLSARSNSAS